MKASRSLVSRIGGMKQVGKEGVAERSGAGREAEAKPIRVRSAEGFSQFEPKVMPLELFPRSPCRQQPWQSINSTVKSLNDFLKQDLSL